ncbi:MAG: HEAT repeat domain-containing protein, partial [Halobacteriaceae archaeon]
DILETEYETTAEEPVDELASQITTVAEEIESRDLDPDQDTATIQSLKEQTEELDSAVDGAEAWDDLTVREKLQAEGFFEAINTKHKDFPPEWSALKEWEAENNTEMILLALDLMDSDFMERHCLEALKRMGDPAAIDPILERAGRRDKEAVRILGKMADEQALDTIQEYITEDSDTGLLRVTLKAVGEIGSNTVTKDVVNALGFDNESVRSHAARSLGMIGDTRAINPLSTVLANDESDTVRASAAWALVQIGTQEALQEVAAYTDDDAFIVQSEAEKAENALTEAPKA